jgi:hypothetical protein
MGYHGYLLFRLIEDALIGCVLLFGMLFLGDVIIVGGGVGLVDKNMELHLGEIVKWLGLEHLEEVLRELVDLILGVIYHKHSLIFIYIYQQIWKTIKPNVY